jgi:hypothetical protein
MRFEEMAAIDGFALNRGIMATKFRTEIARAVNDALLERDRAEMRAVDRLLTLMKPPRRRPSKRQQRKTAAKRRSR